MPALEHAYLIALGSNLGDREATFSRALDALRASAMQIIARSPNYLTAPIGAANQEFLNGVILLQTELEPEALLKRLLEIEETLGRVRRERWGNRSIDLDILLWCEADDWQKAKREPGRESVMTKPFRSAPLAIPHPEMLHRDFMLVPATSIAPRWIHSETGLTLAKECKQRGFKLTPTPREKPRGLMTGDA